MQRPKSANDPYTLCSCGDPAEGIDAQTGEPSCKDCSVAQKRPITDGGRDDLTDDLSDVVEIYDQPVHYRRWPQNAKVSYLINSYSRSQLLRAIRHNIDSDESTDRLKKPELAAISLKMRIDL